MAIAAEFSISEIKALVKVFFSLILLFQFFVGHCSVEVSQNEI